MRGWSRQAKLFAAAVAALLILAAITGGWYLFTGLYTVRTDHLLTHTVRHEKLELTIIERGSLEAAQNNDVVCHVKTGKQATTIKWVIDDGTQVKRGDSLAELDDTDLQDQLKLQKGLMDKAESDWIYSEEQYKITISQNESDIEAAIHAKELAEIDIEKYMKGDYEKAKKELLGQILMAKSDLEMWEARAGWTKSVSKLGITTASAVAADEARCRGAEIAYQKLQEQFRVLEQYEFKQEYTKRKATLDESVRALDRAKLKARSTEIQADADRQAKRSAFEQARDKYEELLDEIRKCHIYAPQDGLVVYYIPEQTRFGSGTTQSTIAQGEPVREGQKMMRIPDLSKMLVNVRVHEAMVSRVRDDRWKKTGFTEAVQGGASLLFDPISSFASQMAFSQIRADFCENYRAKDLRLSHRGQEASIRLDAYPGKSLRGHVQKVATVASQSDWLSSDVKVYQTMIAIDDPLLGMRPGMSAEVTVFTESHLESVLTVPVQSVFGTVDMGSTRHCFVMTPLGPEEREVVMGVSNERMVEVKSGLQEGDVVVLNPRALLSEKDRQRFGLDKGGSGKGGAPGKGGDNKKGAKGTRSGKGGAGGRPNKGGAGGGPPSP